MATVPTSGTDIRLLSGIPFNSDYKNTRWFTSKSSQTNWFLNRNIVHTISEANFQRIEGYHFIAVNKSIDELWGTNYVMFRNSQYNNKWFYGFVTNIEYKQRNNTHVYFQIDVLQTWKFDMNFKPSYVVREHKRLWNSNGTPVVNTVPEQLDYGDMYETVSVDRWLPYGDNAFIVVVAKEVMHELEGKEIEPTYNGVPQPLSYYIHPFNVKTGQTPNVDVNKSHGYGESDPLTFLRGMFTQENAVNNVVSVYITDYTGLPISYNSSTDTLSFAPVFEGVAITDDQNVNVGTIYFHGPAFYSNHTKTYSNKYTGFEDVEESKLLMYPYAFTELTDFKGNQIQIKNEYIDGKELKLIAKGSAGTSNQTSYGVQNYLSESLNRQDQQLTSLQHAMINSSPNDIPIINDQLSAFMQGNRNSIETQRKQAMWSGAFSLLGATTGGAGAGARMHTANQSLAMFPQLTRVSSATGIASAGVSAVKGMGDTVLQLQSINSKIKDIDNRPASMSDMGSNTNFDYGNEYTGVYIIKKQIRKEYRNILSDFFGMFGYKTNRVKIPNFRTRRNWNYVETESCVITGNFNNEDLQEMKNIFDNGITLWHTDDIGNYSLSNGVR